MIHKCPHLCSVSQKLTAWAKSMCGCCFNMYVKAPRTAFWHALSANQLFFWLPHTVGRYFFTDIANTLSFLLAQIWMCLHTHTCVCVSQYNLCYVQHATLYKTPTLFLSLPVSVHTWLHVDILFLGLKHYFFILYICFSVRFVYCYPFLTLAL